MTSQLRSDLILEMSNGIDDILLDWRPRPTLNEVIAAQVQSLARAISATTDPKPSLIEVKDGLDSIVVELLQRTRCKTNLVTNWHVLAMCDFYNRYNLRGDAGRPNILRTLFNIQTGSFARQRWDIKIRRQATMASASE
jgi:hypothetical protein